jgi:hypothetical protein
MDWANVRMEQTTKAHSSFMLLENYRFMANVLVGKVRNNQRQVYQQHMYTFPIGEWSFHLTTWTRSIHFILFLCSLPVTNAQRQTSRRRWIFKNAARDGRVLIYDTNRTSTWRTWRKPQHICQDTVGFSNLEPGTRIKVRADVSASLLGNVQYWTKKKRTSWTCRKGGVKKGKRKKNWKTQNKGLDEEMNDKKARKIKNTEVEKM